MMQLTEEQKKAPLTQSALKELLHYDAQTGDWTWKVFRGRAAKQGSVAGYSHRDGYVEIRVLCNTYKAHRLAFLYMTGEMPNGLVDHINGNKSDNRWENLRQADKHQNGCNQKLNVKNKSGFKGVTWSGEMSKWRATFRIHKKDYHLGYYSDVELAALVAQEARVKYHGEFYRSCEEKPQ